MMEAPDIVVDNPAFERDSSDDEGGKVAIPIPESNFLQPQVDAFELANTHTYVYEPEKNLHQMTIEAFPDEANYDNKANRPTLEDLMQGKKVQTQEGDTGQELEGKVIKFGWVEGVLMRCLLNIWGTMLFLRLTWVIGQAGIWQGLLIITLCNIVTGLSAISMSAIATNGQIAAGGVYYMISRALGPALGGSIGLMFTIANTISVATYTIGFAESLLDFLADVVPGWDGIVTPISECSVAGCRPNDVRIVGAPSLCLFLFIAFAGMDWVTRIQKSLLVLLIFAQVDMFIGSFIDVEFGTAYVNKIEDGTYYNIDQDQRHAFGYTGWNITTASNNLNPQYQVNPLSDGKEPKFMDLYGVFFTAVTGIVAGANLSGDLKDPAEAIPKGTLLAIVLTFGTYMWFGLTAGFVFLPKASGVKEDYIYTTQGWQDSWGNETFDLPQITNCSSEANDLRTFLKENPDNYSWYDSGNQWLSDDCSYGSGMDQMTMTYISFTGYLRYAGGFSASLSSAIASLVGAPRVLQAVGVDKIYPGVAFFAKPGNANNDPHRGYLLVFAVAFALMLIASLNAVGIIASNFFLAAYALMNLSCFHSSFTNAPSWRPSFTWYNPWVSLFSTVLCIIIMFLMNWIYALVTVLVLIILGAYIMYMKPEANWGSSTQSQVFVSALRAARTLTDTPDHVKTYRPKVLLMTGNPAHRPPLVNFASLITKDTSLLLCGHVISDKNPSNIAVLRDSVQFWMKDHKIKSFYSVVHNENFEEGSKALMSVAGLGKLSPNMVLIGFKSNWKEDIPGMNSYVNMLYAAFDMQLSLGILRTRKGFDHSHIIRSEEVIRNPTVMTPDGKKKKLRGEVATIYKDAEGNVLDGQRLAGIQQFLNKKHTGYIDVWWLYDDGGMTLLLPYILKTRKNYEKCKLRIFSLAKEAGALDKETKNMAVMLAKFRIEYSDVIVVPDIMKKAEDSTKAEFVKSIEGMNIDDRELQQMKQKTNRHLRLAEMLRQYSSESDLIVMTLPLPRKDQMSPALYMAWLEIMTKDLPPVLLTRGNQQSVLTFYS